MKIYTSYFGMSRKLKKSHPDYVQIAICGKMTFPWSGLRYTKLAPKIGFFTEWKKNHDNDYYVEHFTDEVLSTLVREDVIRDLSQLAGGDDKTVVLMCYEKPNEFCHRHLVADWIGGVEEWSPFSVEELFENVEEAHSDAHFSNVVQEYINEMDNVRAISRLGQQIFAKPS